MEEFQKLHETLQAFAKADKGEEIAKHICEDAVFMSPMHDPITVPELKRAKEMGKFKDFAKPDVTHKVENVKIFGEIAIERGGFIAKSSKGEKKGSYLNVWKKEGGIWKLLNGCATIRMPA